MGKLIETRRGLVKLTKQNNGWEFIGDVNPVEHGGIWIRKEEGSEDDYEFVKVQRWFDDHLAIAIGTVCVSDGWIERTEVENYADTSLFEQPFHYVSAVVDYYGIGEFDSSPEYVQVDSFAEGRVRAFLKGRGIEF